VVKVVVTAPVNICIERAKNNEWMFFFNLFSIIIIGVEGSRGREGGMQKNLRELNNVNSKCTHQIEQ